jgi:hypothetical protein
VSSVFPPPPSPPSECLLPPDQRWGVHTRRQWWAKWRLSTFDLYPWGEWQGGYRKICDILRPQLVMNHFLSLWPHRFPHFGYIHPGGGAWGGPDIRSMSSIRPICKCRCPPLLAGRWGDGGSILWKMPDFGLTSYRIWSLYGTADHILYSGSPCGGAHTAEFWWYRQILLAGT